MGDLAFCCAEVCDKEITIAQCHTDLKFHDIDVNSVTNAAATVAEESIVRLCWQEVAQKHMSLLEAIEGELGKQEF